MPEHADLYAWPTPTAMLIGALRRFPERIAFVEGGASISYRALGDTVAGIQSVLAAAGVAPDTVVAILAKNRWDAWAAASAVSALGAAPCWLHPLGVPATHVEQTQQVAPSAIIVDGAAFPDRPSLLAAAAPGVPVFSLDPADGARDLLKAVGEVGATTLRDMSRADAIGMVGITGGTTGRSKAVERSVAGTAAMTISTLASFDIPIAPRFLAVGPISHVTGTKILPSLMCGGTVSILDRFDPEAVLATIARDRISFALAVPTMIYDLLDCPSLGRFDLSSLELLLYGGAAMSPTRLGEALDRVGPVFSQLYGQAECYPIAVLDRADHDPARPDLLAACGFPVRGCDVRLLDEHGAETPSGEVGEICARSPSVMIRYRGDADASREALAGGWLHTGDLGRFDEQGRLYIVDRKKDMIVSGGFNIYPREIEDVLSGHPSVTAAAVVGLPHPRWGEAAHAAVSLRPGLAVDEAELMELVRSRKGSLLTPKTISSLDHLPQTAAGKLDKRRIVQQLLEKGVTGAR